MRKRIKAARKNVGVSQSRLAKLLGVSRSAVAQWESVEGTLPHLDNLVQLSRVLGVDFAWLATGEVRGTQKKQSIPKLVEEPVLSQQEIKILGCIRRMPVGKRRALAVFLDYD